MEYKKSIIIIILTVFLFSIASVCASDVNDTIIAHEDTAPIEVAQTYDVSANDDSQAIEQPNDEEIMGEGNVGTFSELQVNITENYGSSLKLYKNYEYDDGFDTQGITINDSITIDGQGHTIDAKGLSRIFNVAADNVIVMNITFLNGHVNGNGGAINGACTAIGCNFTNNSANGYEDVKCGGGAMYGGWATDCYFIGNHFYVDKRGLDPSLNYCGGGAMYGGWATDCYFIDNYVKGYDKSSGEPDDGAGAHSSRKVYVYGGAMNSGNALNCVFTGNYASYGGAMYDCSAVNCVFKDNLAKNEHLMGSAMYEGSADSCIFKNYEIWDTYNTIIDSPVLKVDNFTSFVSSGDKITFNLTTNGGMPINNANISISVYFKNNNSWFGNYSCLNGEGWTVDLPVGYYYAIFNTEYLAFAPVNRTLTILAPNTTFWALNFTINANKDSQINLANDYSFDPAYDTDFADGIVINRTVTINGNGFTIDAKNQARIFNIQADGVTVRNLTFKNANTSGSGGAIYWEGANGIVSSCSFVNNSARFFGGAINWGGINGVVSACSFVNNSANYSGGAINWGSRNGAVSGCSFENNSASNGGGAVRWSSTDGFLCNSSFVNNSAPNGGAVFWLIGPGSVCNCSFLNNSAGEGIVYFKKDVGSGLNVNGNIFSANNCSAIAFLKSDLTSNIDSNWYDNDADYEGGPNLPQQNSWLVLNATADPATISYSDTAEVMFALYLYNPVSGNSSLYDSAQFEKIRLSITAIRGNAPSLAKFGEKITFTPTEAGNGGVTATLGRKSLTFNLTINKAQTAFEASPVTAKYGEDKYLTVTLRDDKGNPLAGASITVNMNGIKTYTTDKNGQIKVKTQGIVPKTYTAKIAFGGNANYVQSAKDVKITIKKAKPKLAAKNKKFKKSKKVKKYAVTLKDANKKPIKKAKLTLKIKGKKAITVKTNKKGKATFKIKKLTKKGTYKAKITYKGNNCYFKVTKTVKIKLR